MVWPKNAKNRVKTCRSEITGDLYSFSHFSRKPLILEACFLIQFFLSFRDGHFKGYVDYVSSILKISINIGIGRPSTSFHMGVFGAHTKNSTWVWFLAPNGTTLGGTPIDLVKNVNLPPPLIKYTNFFISTWPNKHMRTSKPSCA